MGCMGCGDRTLRKGARVQIDGQAFGERIARFFPRYTNECACVRLIGDGRETS